jgi:hypothetical protein
MDINRVEQVYKQHEMKYELNSLIGDIFNAFLQNNAILSDEENAFRSLRA